MKLRGRDSNHRERNAGQVDGFPHRRGVLGKSPLPIVVAEHCYGRLPGLVVIDGESPAEGGADTQHVEVAPRHEIAVNKFWMAVNRHTHGAPIPREDAREGMAAVAELFESRVGKVIFGAACGRDSVDEHQVLRVLDGEQSKEEGVHKAEDGGVRPDAERERQHRHGCEAGILGQHPQAVAQILP